MGSSPTAPTIWSFRAGVPKGCGLISFRCRRDSNPRGGERQADAQRPQRAGEGAGRRPKPVRICAANTQTSHRPYHVLFTSPCPPGMRACFFWMPVGLEPARGRASSGRAASVSSRRGRRQAAEAGADLRSKYADVPPPLPRIVYEPVSPRDAGSFLLDAVIRRTANLGRSFCDCSYQPKDCPQVPAEKERPQVPAVELRWNRDCLVPERAILVRISPQLI